MKQEVVNLYNQLNTEWNKKPQDLKKCVDILGQLKVSDDFDKHFKHTSNQKNKLIKR